MLQIELHHLSEKKYFICLPCPNLDQATLKSSRVLLVCSYSSPKYDFFYLFNTQINTENNISSFTYCRMSTQGSKTWNNMPTGDSIVSETSKSIFNLESTLLSRLYNLTQEFLNVKDIKNLQIHNERLRKKSLTLKKGWFLLKVKTIC